VKTSHASKIDRGFLFDDVTDLGCCINFGGVVTVTSLMRSSCVIVMLRLPPKQGVCCSDGGEDVDRFLRDWDRNLAAVSPNSAVDVIVASSNRTVLLCFGVLVFDAGADKLPVADELMAFPVFLLVNIPHRWRVVLTVTSSSLLYVAPSVEAPKRSLYKTSVNS